MKLYANPTSPFVRLVRIVIVELGLEAHVDVDMVDAWADRPDFLAANPAGRVPALVTDEGLAITESGMILRHLERLVPDRPLFPEAGGDLSFARAGIAQGAFEAAVAIIIGRKSKSDFDEDPVGSKRHRTMREALSRLDSDLPPEMGATLDLSAIATVVAWDYILFRFPDEDWRTANPNLAEWRDRQGHRPSLVSTQPPAN